ncbi:MAG: alcohol dehydrogenase catalytic domain-containing protein [Actinobacteria bacterium]|nr:alcohol dehydrogenase catalytic domain-containing protein [Actinomycetota bacterium]
MLGTRFTGNKKVVYKEFPKPKAKDDLVVIKVMASALCGTDLPFYRASTDVLGAIPGHEIAGEVAEVDRTVSLKVGDRVIVSTQVGCGSCDNCRNGQVLFCNDMRTMGVTPGFNGGHAEYVQASEKDCLNLPDEIPYDVGSVIPDCLGVPYHSTGKMGITSMDSVVVFGTGPIGLGMVIMLKYLGAFTIAVEMNEYRRNLASQFGANVAINPDKDDVIKSILDITDGEGVDKAIDCAAGTDVTTNQSLRVIKNGGKVAFIGEKERVCLDNLREMIIHKETIIYGSCGYNISEYGKLIKLVKRGFGIGKLITHRFNFTEVAEAYQLFDTGNTGKVVIIH